jgi:hypothetical protein
VTLISALEGRLLETFKTSDGQDAIILKEFERNERGRYILCCVPTAYHPFIVWFEDIESSSRYYGGYHLTVDEALIDFEGRVYAL